MSVNNNRDVLNIYLNLTSEWNETRSELKNTVKIKDLKSMVKDLVNKNPDLYAVIIVDRNSSTSDLVRVMDQLKSAGIENISMAATKPN